jgi:hypothetical protein
MGLLDSLRKEREQRARRGWLQLAAFAAMLAAIFMLWTLWSGTYLRTGRGLVISENYDEAKLQFHSALLLRRRAAECHDGMGVASLFQRRFEEARRHFEDSLSRGPGTLFEPEDICRRLIARGDYAACRFYLDYLKEWQPEDSPYLLYYLAYVLNAAEVYLEAEKRFLAVEDDAEFGEAAKRHLRYIKFKKRKHLAPRYLDRRGRTVAAENLITSHPVSSAFEVLTLIGKPEWPGTLWDALPYFDRRNRMHMALDLDIAKAASDALGKRRGALVALEPRTGAVLAAVSHPAKWSTYQPPLKNRAFFDLHPPASTAKPLLVAKALASGHPVEALFPWTCTARLRMDGGTIICLKAHGRLDTLDEAMAVSCNTVLARLAVDMGERALREMWREAGLGPRIAVYPLRGIPTGELDAEPLGPYALGRLALGLDGVRTSPVYLAALAAGLAMEGDVPVPYLIDHKANLLDEVYERAKPQVWRALRPRRAVQIARGSMRAPVEHRRGTARGARVEGLACAVKTGSFGSPATGSAWTLGWAPYEEPRVAWALFVEGQGLSSRGAVPATKAFLENLTALGFFADNEE